MNAVDRSLRLPPRAAGTARALVVVLHGVGSSPEAMAETASELSAGLPHAAIAVPEGIEPFDGESNARQWFSIAGITEENRPARVAGALPRLEDRIAAERARVGIDPARTAFVGFSQGAIMALHIAAESAHPPAAVVSFAGRLAGPVQAGPGARPAVLLSHGTADPVIGVEQLDIAATRLRHVGCAVSIERVRGHGHGVAPVQIVGAIKHVYQALTVDSVRARL